MTETCGNCKFWSAYNNDDIHGDCRRYPKSIHVYADHEGDVDSQYLYPPHDNDDWCGEWKSKESDKEVIEEIRQRVEMARRLDER